MQNHSDEVEQKILSVLDALLTQQLQTWQPSKQLPSKTFKDLCIHFSKVHDSVKDVWSQGTTSKIMTKVNLIINFSFFKKKNKTENPFSLKTTSKNDLTIWNPKTP